LSYNFYKNNCYAQCPDETYPDNGICFTCSESCSTCFGSGNSQCIDCNKDQGYIKDPAKKVCSLLTCGEGTIFEPTSDEPTCVGCHESCATCRGKSHTDCINCRRGLNPLPGLKEGEILCQTCENKIGYKTGPDGSCIGIIYKHT